MPSPITDLIRRRLFDSPLPPNLGPVRRSGTLAEKEIRQVWEEILREAPLPALAREPLLSLALLWHDHLEASHSISQQIHTYDGSYIHGMMHRREPDYGNAKYWFNRVGSHPTFNLMGDKVLTELHGRISKVSLAELVQNGVWDPFRFIDACEAASGHSPTDPFSAELTALQALEFLVMLDHLTN